MKNATTETEIITRVVIFIPEVEFELLAASFTFKFDTSVAKTVTLNKSLMPLVRANWMSIFPNRPDGPPAEIIL